MTGRPGVVLAATLALTGAILAFPGARAAPPPSAAPTVAVEPVRPPLTESKRVVKGGQGRALPVSVDIPAIGLHALIRPAVLPGNETVHGATGWYEQVPGRRAGLAAPRPGDLVSVHRFDGGIVNFRIITVRRYPDGESPGRGITGSARHPELRLTMSSVASSPAGRVVIFARAIGD